MNTATFEDLQELWQAQAPVVHPHQASRLLAKAQRKARFLEVRDYTLFALALAAMIPNLLKGGTPLGWLLGIVFIVVMGTATLRRRRRAQLSSGMGSDQKATLRGLIRLARGEARYQTIAALTATPFLASVLFWKWYLRAGEDITRVDDVIMATHPLRLAFFATVFGALIGWALWKRRRAIAELSQFQKTLREFEDESA